VVLLPIDKHRRDYTKRPRAFQDGGEVEDDAAAVTASAANAAASAQNQRKTLATATQDQARAAGAAAPVRENPSATRGALGSASDPEGNTKEGHVWNPLWNTWSPALR
jgi:hypothetical protein